MVRSGDFMKIYIAGPMTPTKTNQAENFNFDAFDQVRDYLKAAGHHPISPADIDRLYEGWKVYPPAGFASVQQCCIHPTHLLVFRIGNRS